MKRYWTAVLFCGLLCLFGCGVPQQELVTAQIAQTAALPFTCSGTLTLEGTDTPLSLSVDKRADGLVLTVNGPEPLAGLRLEFDEELAHLHYREMAMSLMPGDIPEQSVLWELREVLAAMPLQEAEADFRQGQVALTGRAGMTPYTTVWSEDGTTLSSIFLPNCGASLTIDRFAGQSENMG